MPHSGQDGCSLWRCLGPQWRCPERSSVLHAEATVVQFARSTADDEEFALKFFISREKFEAERTVFAHWILGAMMPRLEGMYDNRDAALQDPRGHALPPCVIMERGESLQQWFKRRKPDLRTALPVRPHRLCPPAYAFETSAAATMSNFMFDCWQPKD